MNVILSGLAAEAVKELVIPVLSAVLLTYGTLLAAKIKKKTGVDITEKLNALLHRALERGAQALVEEISAKSLGTGSIGEAVTRVAVKEAADKLARQISVTMPDTLKGLGSPSASTLTKLAEQALERAFRSKK